MVTAPSALMVRSPLALMVRSPLALIVMEPSLAFRVIVLPDLSAMVRSPPSLVSSKVIACPDLLLITRWLLVPSALVAGGLHCVVQRLPSTYGWDTSPCA